MYWLVVGGLDVEGRVFWTCLGCRENRKCGAVVSVAAFLFQFKYLRQTGKKEIKCIRSTQANTIKTI